MASWEMLACRKERKTTGVNSRFRRKPCAETHLSGCLVVVVHVIHKKTQAVCVPLKRKHVVVRPVEHFR